MKHKQRLSDAGSRADDPLWYKDAVIYELHVRAFADSNGDGIGDLRGLVGKLDYLQDLGVTALWLLPFYPSPLRDDGYDIASYTDVHPTYGNLDDFKVFLAEAHRRGLRVITELVINHTSDQHPWFQRARRAPAGSPERDFYVWSDSPKRYEDARIIFKDFEPSNWTWDPVANAYFWHRFYNHQPDLNYDNPAVQEAAFEALDFWFNLGVDGLRLDAIPYLYEREGTSCENLPETHAYLKRLRKHVDEKFTNRMLLAEANQWPEDSVAYFGSGDECHMAFHFPVMPRLFMAIHMEDRFPITDILQQTPAIPDNCHWAMFLRNHDELTLEMVTDEDRDYMYRIYAQDPQARINLGIRRRLAPLLENHRGKIELMNGLLFSLPGAPVLYYGDEIGMGDNIYLGDRHGVRTPMQWNAERNAGFSQANPQRLYLPLVIDPAYHFEALNVAAQQDHPHSLLWWMKRLIGLRKRYRALSRGSLEFVATDNPKVLAFVRRWQDESLLVVANLSRFVQPAELDLSGFQGMVPVEAMGRTRFPAVEHGPYTLTLSGYGFYWLNLQKPRDRNPGTDIEPIELSINGSWETVFRLPGKEVLEEQLPTYLHRCSWFQGRSRPIDAVTILDTVPIPFDLGSAQVVLLRVAYTEGDPETYALPLAFVTGERAEQVPEPLPPWVLGWLTLRERDADGRIVERPGVLLDPLGEEKFSRALAEAALHARVLKGGLGEMCGRSFEGEVELPAAAPALLKGTQSNSAVVYGDRCFLKLFRRLEAGPHPEVEVGRFLADRTDFRAVASVLGSLEYRGGRNPPVTLAVLESWVPNEGDAWRFTLDALGRYYDRALVSTGPRPEPPEGPLLDLAAADVPGQALEHIGTYAESARLLGRRTAEMHRALTSRDDDPGFAPEPFPAHYERSLYQSFRAQLRQALALLRKRLKELPEAVRPDAQKLLGQEDRLLTRAQRIYERKIAAQRTRCHGDYHLAQILYTGKDFVVIDFEGPAAAPLSDRNRKRSPLRDVASMLLSFQYAAQVALEGGRLRPEDVTALAPWSVFWQRWVSVLFVQAYLEALGEIAFLPPSNEGRSMLLDFYLLKRAAGDLRYELINRIDRVPVRIQALLQRLETTV